MRRVDRTDEIEALLRRMDVLDRLCRSPAHIRDLVAETGQSRSTINRAIKELESLEFVDRSGDGVEATLAGRLAHDNVGTFLADFDDIRTATAVLERLPVDTAIDPEAVAGGEPILATNPAPYRPLERLYDDLSQATRYRALVPTLEDPRHIRVLYEHVVTEGNPAELIVTPEVFETLRTEFPRRSAAMAEEAGLSVFVGDVPAFGLGLLGRELPGEADEATTTYVVVFDDRGSVHGILVNDVGPAVEWAESTYVDHRNEATDRTEELIPNTDGGVVGIGSVANAGSVDGSLPVSLERQGFVRVDVSYFHEEPVDHPTTAWRSGLSIAEVHTGYAIDRSHVRIEDELTEDERTEGGLTEDERTEGGLTEDERTEDGLTEDERTEDEWSASATTDTASKILDALETGADTVVVGPPGSGKSTICKQVACRWYDEDRGPVYYRESDRGRALTSVEDLLAVASASDGHVLCVVEDAVRPDASAIFEAIDRLDGRDDVSFLLDSRETEWRDRTEWHDRLGESVDASAIDVVHVPAMTETDCDRLVSHFERTVGKAVDVPTDRLWAAVREEAPGRASETNQMLRVIHRLSSYADPLADGPTALEEAVATVYETVAEDELTRSVCVLVNVLNAAGIAVDRGLLYALGPVDDRVATTDAAESGIDTASNADVDTASDEGFDTASDVNVDVASDGDVDSTPDADVGVAVDTAIEKLEGHVLFPRGAGGREVGGYRTVHEEWSTVFLAHFVEVEGATAAARRFQQAVGPLLALADDPERCGRIASRLADARTLNAIVDDPEAWADDTVEALYSILRDRYSLAPLFGDGTTDGVDVPDACSEAIVEQLPVRLGDAFVDGGYLDRAERAYKRLDGDDPHLGAERRLGLARISIERGEYDRAIEICQTCVADAEAAGEVEIRARAVVRLGEALTKRGEFDEATDRFLDALETFQRADSHRWTIETLQHLATVAIKRGAFDRARDHYETGLELASMLGDRRSEAEIHNELGKVCAKQGAFAEATERLEQCLESRRTLGDRPGVAESLNNLGIVASRQGEYERASRLFERSLEHREELDDRHGQAATLGNLGLAMKGLGDRERAGQMFDRSIVLYRELGDHHGEAVALNNLGIVARQQGAFDRAGEVYERSLEIFGEHDDTHGEAKASNNLAIVHRARGEYDRAERLFERSLEKNRSIGDRAGEANTLYNLGVVARLRGALDLARQLSEESFDLSREIGEYHGEARAAANLGMTALRTGETDRACEHFERGLERGTETGASEEIARCQIGLASIAIEDGDYDGAADRLDAAAEALDGDDPALELRITLTRSRLDRARGTLDDAESHAIAALDDAEELGVPYLRGRSTLILGQIDSDRGSIDDARGHFNDALDTFEAIGAYDDAMEALTSLLETYQDDGAMVDETIDEGMNDEEMNDDETTDKKTADVETAVAEWRDRGRAVLANGPDELADRHGAWMDDG